MPSVAVLFSVHTFTKGLSGKANGLVPNAHQLSNNCKLFLPPVSRADCIFLRGYVLSFVGLPFNLWEDWYGHGNWEPAFGLSFALGVDLHTTTDGDKSNLPMAYAVGPGLGRPCFGIVNS